MEGKEKGATQSNTPNTIKNNTEAKVQKIPLQSASLPANFYKSYNIYKIYKIYKSYKIYTSHTGSYSHSMVAGGLEEMS